MFDQDTIDPEYIEKHKEYVKTINDNKIKIEINEDEIKFTTMIGISYYQYIKEYKYEEIIRELDILKHKDKDTIYNYLINSEF